MGARSNDESRSVSELLLSLSLSLSLSFSFFLSLYLLTQRQLSPVGFDPCGVYDLPVQSAFFRRFLREPCEIYLGRFYCFMPSCAGRGVPSDASITGSELHPGSLRIGPTVSREERRKLKRKREVERDPAGISFRHLVGRGRAASRWSENRRIGDMVRMFSIVVFCVI